MSFGAREPAWRRREQDRARQQREAHEARRRQALGLAPIQPRRVENPGFAMDFGTSTITAATSAFNSYRNSMDNMRTLYHHYQLGISVPSAIPNIFRETIDIPQDSEAKKWMCADPEPAEREPTLLEAWRD